MTTRPHPQRPRTRRPLAALAFGALFALGATACGDDGSGTTGDAAESSSSTSALDPVIDPGDGGRYAPTIDPASFVADIDNPYLPLRPGARWVYEGDSDGEHERIEVVVTDETREIGGITATVVRDTVHVDGEMVEDTYDWFAQDRDGNVWYLGEDSHEIVDGAIAGIVMPARPAAGDAFRQEYLRGEAEDLGEIIEVAVAKEIGLGAYDDVVVTRDWTPLEPEVAEEKWYARGVGKIREAHVAGGSGTVELVQFEPGS
jgi:hypothetical protein